MDRHESEPEEGEVEEPQRRPSSTSSTRLSQASAAPRPAPAELKIKHTASSRPSYEAHTSPALAAPSRAVPSLLPSSTGSTRPKVVIGFKAPPTKVPVAPARPPQSPRKSTKGLTMKGAAKEAATRAPTNGAAEGPAAEAPLAPSPVLPIPPPPTPVTSLAVPSPRAATPPRPAPSTLPRPPSSVPSRPPLETIAQQDSRPSSPVRPQPLRADVVAEVVPQSVGGGEGDKGGERWGHEGYGQQEGRSYQREQRGGEALGHQTYIPAYGSREGRDGGRRDDNRDYRSRSGSAAASGYRDRVPEARRDRRSRSRSRDGDRRRSDSGKHRPTSYHRDDDPGGERKSDRGHSSRSRDERDPYRSERRGRDGERMGKRRASDDGHDGSGRGGDDGGQSDVVLNYDEQPAKRRKQEQPAERPRKNPSRSPPTPSPPRSPSPLIADSLAQPLQKPRSRKGRSRSRSRSPDRDSKSSSRRRSRSPPRAKAPSPRRRPRSPQRSEPYDSYGNRPGDRPYYNSHRPANGARYNDDRRSCQDQSGWGSRPSYGDAYPGRPYEQRPGQSQGGWDAQRDMGAPRQRDGRDGPESSQPLTPPRPSSDISTAAAVPQGHAAPAPARKPITLKLPPPPPATSTAPSRSVFSDAPILPSQPPPPPPPLLPTFANPSPPSSVTYDESRQRPQSAHAPLHPSISALNSLATSPTTVTPEPYSSTSRTPGPHSRRAAGTSGYVVPPGVDWLREPSPEPIALGGMPQKNARDELVRIGSSHISEYTLQQKLGEGTFGLVWLGVRGKVDKKGKGVAKKGIDKNEEKLVARGLRVRKGDVVALKEILVHNESDGMPITSLREIRILKELDHPNVVPVVDIAYDEGVRDTFKLGKTYMVFPYMDHDLAGLLENPAVKFETHHIKQYAKQLLRGTAYLHNNGILHRDMKAANLLINNKGVLMIADFGLARSIEKVSKGRSYTNCVVTRWYRPPELLLGDQKYHTPVDMWGVGCVIAEMFKKKPIFPGTSDVDQAQRIFSMCGSPTEYNMPGWSKLPGCEGIISWSACQRRIASEYQEYGEDFVGLMEHLLVLDPRKRLTAVEALDHKWFWSEPYPTDPKLMPVFPSSHEFDRRKREELQQAAYPAPQPRPHPPPLNQAHQPRPSFGQAPHGRPPYGAPPQNGGPPGFPGQPMRFDMGPNPLPPPFGGPPPGFQQPGFQSYPQQQQRQFQQPPFHPQQHQGAYPPQRGPNYGDQRGPPPASSGKVSLTDMLSKRSVGGKPPPTGPRNGNGGGGQGGGAGGRAPLNYSDV